MQHLLRATSLACWRVHFFRTTWWHLHDSSPASLIVPLAFLLVQHGERLQQLMLGTLHHTQPGLGFVLKCSEDVKKSSEKGKKASVESEWKWLAKMKMKRADVTSKWKASCRIVSPSRWRTCGTFSSSTRRPYWGLACKLWSAGLRPLPAMLNEKAVL